MSNLLNLLDNTRVQVLIHVLVLDGILGSLLRRGDAGVQMLQLRAEAHADFERIRHFDVIVVGAGVIRSTTATFEDV
jgi:hypothetical protein